MTTQTLDLTTDELHAVEWAVALVGAVAARATSEGRHEVAAHVQKLPDLAELKPSLSSGILAPPDADAIADAVRAALGMYSSLPAEIWTTLRPPEKSVMLSASKKLRAYRQQTRVGFTASDQHES